MERVEWFDERFYKIYDKDGQICFYPSVTTILSVTPKPFLTQWKGEVGNEEANRISNEAKTRGSIVHNAIDWLHSGGQVSLGDSWYLAEKESESKDNILIINDQFNFLMVYRYTQLYDKLKPTIISSEELIYSHKYKYAGTMDIIMEINAGDYLIDGAKPINIKGGKYICDIKTGKSLSPDYWLQLAAYKKAKEEMVGEVYDGALIIHTNSMNKKGIEGLGVKVKYSEELEEEFDLFMKFYDIYLAYPKPTPKVFDMPKNLTLKKKG